MADNLILTSQIISDMIHKPNRSEERRIQYKIKCIGTESEPYLTVETVKYKFSLTKVDLIQGTEKTHEFTRRYNHFKWLQNELTNKYLGRIIPCLPDPDTNYDKDRRKLEFVIFMQKLFDHKKILYADCVEKFFSEELCDFQIFQDYIDKMSESKSIFPTIFKGIFGAVSKFSQNITSYNSVQILPRAIDDYDKECEEIKKELERDKQITEIICSDIRQIVQKIQIQSRSLASSQDIFMNECQSTDEFRKLIQIIKIYECVEIQFKQKFVVRLETCIKDYDSALTIIIQYKELKEQLNKDTQLIAQPQYKSQIEELKQKINDNKQKIEQIQNNFKDDIQLFREYQRIYLTDIQSNFNNELQQFYDSIKSVKRL